MNFKWGVLAIGLFWAGHSMAAPTVAPPEFVDPPVFSSSGRVLDIVMEATSMPLDGLPNNPRGAAYNVCLNKDFSSGACSGSSSVHPYGGVRLQVNPGDTLKIKLLNKLASVPSSDDLSGSFLGSNPTNLHLHGFLVAPEWPTHPADTSVPIQNLPSTLTFGDNIFAMVRSFFGDPQLGPDSGGKTSHVHGAILPQDEMDFSVRIPISHPSGLSFFHPHVHGLTGRQIASGLSGILTVGSLKDNVTNWPDGGIDVRHVTLKDAQIKTGLGLQTDQDPDFCKSTQVFGPGYCQVTDGLWVFTLSGQQSPNFTVKSTGQIWRITNSSSNVTYNLELKRGNAKIPFQVLSVDGITVTLLGKDQSNPGLTNGDACPGSTKSASLCTTTLHMMPGSRADIWIANRDGSGKVIPGDGTTATFGTAGYATGPDADHWPAIDLGTVTFARGNAQNLPQVLALSDVHQTNGGINFSDIADNLATENNAVGPNLDKNRDCKPLKAGYKRRIYLGYPDQDTFGVGISTIASDGTESSVQSVESFPFAANSICTSMTNLKANYETWEIVNLTPEDHNFHIHQTRFKVYPQGSDTSNSLNPILGVAEQDSAVIPAAIEARQGSCLGKVDIPNNSNSNWGKLGSGKVCQSDPVTIRVPFAIAGDFVFHCHILEHEDKGMMGVVHVSSESH